MSATQARATRRVSQPGSVVGPESDARHRRDHEVESVGGIASVSGGSLSGPARSRVLEDRHRPAMGADEAARRARGNARGRGGPAACRSRRELGIGVQPRLVRAPVEARAPVVDELANIVERNPVAPVDALELVGPTCTDEAVVQVVEDVLRNVDTDRIHGCVGHAGDDIDQCGLFQSSLSARLGACLVTSTRLLKLLALLQSRRTWTGAELAERLGGRPADRASGRRSGCGAWATPSTRLPAPRAAISLAQAPSCRRPARRRRGRSRRDRAGTAADTVAGIEDRLGALAKLE